MPMYDKNLFGIILFNSKINKASSIKTTLQFINQKLGLKPITFNANIMSICDIYIGID